MGAKILIDTNIAIGYIGNSLSIVAMNSLDTIFNNEYHISVINKIELPGYGQMLPLLHLKNSFPPKK